MAETATTTTGENKAPYDHRLYCTWYNMLARCSDPDDHHYARYGGRGIKVCREWRSYDAFFRWALANGYDEALTIDRIDNDGDYTPGNCRWATPRQQANNRSNNRHITVAGHTLTHAQWARALGISRQAIRQAIKRGVPAEWYIRAHIEAGRGEQVALRPMITLARNISVAAI